MQPWIRRILLSTFLGVFTVAAHAANTPLRITTSVGVIDVVLYDDDAPETVKNFLDLVDNHFYDGLIFHRVVAGFVIQAGGYDANLQFREPPRTVVNESKVGMRNRKGTLAMARLPDPDSADSQFYINVQDNRSLDAKPGIPGYTVFGEVTGDWQVVETIELTEVGSRDGMQGVPVVPVTIEKIERL
ncbi:MAG: peptidylprolyl isomerase [Pseudomonadales bacterium]|nr:peptidylprolyl isomerase [Pseudomonadales bacterium]MCP5182429.1 peptidylprolyl isomerase [Pseudomonadales bacterium]